eukprot:3643958-Rhodomonas_salina.1
MTSEYNEWYKVTWKSPKPDLQKALNHKWYPAKVDCICDPGFQGAGGGPCAVCPPNHFCSGGLRTSCPGNASSRAGSTEITD